jgi:hypothetical protein
MDNFVDIEKAVDIRINQAHSRLQKKTVYLGDPDAKTQLMWYRPGHGSFVIDKSTLPKQNEASPSKQTKVPASLTEPANLSCIVLLSWDGFFLHPNGRWDGSNTYSKTLADVKLSCTGSPPDYDGLTAEFAKVIETIDALIARAHTPNFGKQSLRFASNIDSSQRIKFRHVLFTVSNFNR